MFNEKPDEDVHTISQWERSDLFDPSEKKNLPMLTRTVPTVHCEYDFRCGGSRTSGPAREGPHGGLEGGHGSPGMGCDEMLGKWKTGKKISSNVPTTEFSEILRQCFFRCLTFCKQSEQIAKVTQNFLRGNVYKFQLFIFPQEKITN